jgi:hypothetical protein
MVIRVNLAAPALISTLTPSVSMYTVPEGRLFTISASRRPGTSRAPGFSDSTSTDARVETS